MVYFLCVCFASDADVFWRSVLLNFFVMVLSSGCTPLGKHCLFFWPKGDKGEHEKNQLLGTRWVQCAQEKGWRWF